MIHDGNPSNVKLSSFELLIGPCRAVTVTWMAAADRDWPWLPSDPPRRLTQSTKFFSGAELGHAIAKAAFAVMYLLRLARAAARAGARAPAARIRDRDHPCESFRFGVWLPLTPSLLPVTSESLSASESMGNEVKEVGLGHWQWAGKDWECPVVTVKGARQLRRPPARRQASSKMCNISSVALECRDYNYTWSTLWTQTLETPWQWHWQGFHCQSQITIPLPNKLWLGYSVSIFYDFKTTKYGISRPHSAAAFWALRLLLVWVAKAFLAPFSITATDDLPLLGLRHWQTPQTRLAPPKVPQPLVDLIDVASLPARLRVLGDVCWCLHSSMRIFCSSASCSVSNT